VIILAAASIDGYLAEEDGRVGFLEEFGDVEFGYQTFLDSIGTVVMGRRTYDQALTFGEWPYAGKRTLVMTRRPVDRSAPGVEAVEGSVENILERVNGERGDVWLVGGAEVFGQFLASGNVDSIRLFTVPVILGRGIPLFPSGLPTSKWRLKESRVYDKGLCEGHYEKL
jgi:dihydrofolate reductase